MFHRILTLMAALLLTACASNPAPVPVTTPTLHLPMQLHVQREQGGQRQDWLLVIQAEGPGLRWSLLDPLGIPQARQILRDGAWQADGLLPPNPEARELFAGILFALTPGNELARAYPDGDWHTSGQKRRWGKHGEERWRVHYRNPGLFELEAKDALNYEVKSVEPTP